jgi:hypothetical protein
MNVAAPLILILTLVLPDAPTVLPDTPTDEIHAAPAAPQKSDEGATAESLFRQGVQAYDAHDYVHAIERFRASYRLSRAPAILFDIGQAYGALGDCRHALENFDAFVAAAGPDDPLVARARARQAELRPSCPPAVLAAAAEPRVEKSKSKPPVLVIKSGPAPAGTGAAAITSSPPTQGRFFGTTWGTTCAAAAGGALALTATGVALSLRASSLAEEVRNSGIWDPPTQRKDAQGQAFADSATATFVAAGITGVFAAVGCWLGWRNASHQEQSAGRR